MDKVNVNPLVIILFYALRCLVPLGLMLGGSLLLRKLGLVREPAPPPENWTEDGSGDSPAPGDASHE